MLGSSETGFGGTLGLNVGYRNMMMGAQVVGNEEFDGYGTPIEFNFTMAAKNIGLGLSLILNVNDENPSTGFFVGVPFGLLRG